MFILFKFMKEETEIMSDKQILSKSKENLITIDPYSAQMLIIRSEMYIVYNYPHLVSTNQKLNNRDISEIIPENSAIFIIKSFTEEDIHKAIKYNVWSSTNYGNNRLNLEFKNRPVFLLFSTYKSNIFTGLAQMKSEVNFKNVFPLWARENWRGTFDIEWLVIKDVPFKEFREVKCEKREKKLNGEYNFISYSIKSLANSPDCQSVDTEEGKEIIKILIEYQNKNSILEHFEYYDRRQLNYEASLNMMTGNTYGFSEGMNMNMNNMNNMNNININMTNMTSDNIDENKEKTIMS